MTAARLSMLLLRVAGRLVVLANRVGQDEHAYVVVCADCLRQRLHGAHVAGIRQGLALARGPLRPVRVVAEA